MTIQQCRICHNPHLETVIHLGDMALTGTFPKPAESVLVAPLELLRCVGGCGLVQLKNSVDPHLMYCRRYGYLSALNSHMVEHLRKKAQALQEKYLQEGDLVVDIGSNDGTFLNKFSDTMTRVGIDPGPYGPYHGAQCVQGFFSAALVRKAVQSQAQVVTSLAMLYDLEDPQTFVNDVASLLAPEGVWHSEQAYLPSMLKLCSYDTVCHEHLEYYALAQISWLLRVAGMRMLDVEFNTINGGSFAFTACLQASKRRSTLRMAEAVRQEEWMGLQTTQVYAEFSRRTQKHIRELKALLESLVKQGYKLVGYGASTKGNVILQACGITSSTLACIAEINTDKYGMITPGTGIPIVSEAEAKAMRPDYMVVLPWAFRDHIVERENEYLKSGGRLIFPLPEIEIVSESKDLRAMRSVLEGIV